MSEHTRIMLGRINGLYGVGGWLKIFSYTNPRVNILNYSPWLLYHQKQWQTMLVSEGKKQGKGIIVRLDTIHDRNEATHLLGADIFVDRSQLSPTLADEYYWADLIGLTVINCQGITLGQVDYLIETGANDVLVLKGEYECLIPFVLNHTVLEIDLTQRVLRVDWEADFNEKS
ncbi:ribosome maturation factor RimM [Candidatus Parabeggiatoa sp. HSG14]|uniref:ribosome maturation factor RimM n=1 Tax=Candidatus Parabeggiatoa sp. HSG14 TaxID=3055593 RepID=UPI0025A79CD8|nr:ribosome maturation factor RimM [Thiotrichales bacterium HSG14]